MSNSKKRTDTLRVLISGHSVLGASPERNALVGEVNCIAASSRVSGRNGWLLQVLYTTRTLDTSLAVLIKEKGWAASPPSLGEYLKVLRNKGAITEVERLAYRKNVVDVRNKYMHQAGRFPNQLVADDLLAEMQVCIARILAILVSP